jgi:hypothetical protein
MRCVFGMQIVEEHLHDTNIRNRAQKLRRLQDVCFIRKCFRFIEKLP